ncbi:GDP-L-fucose synthase [Arcobacter aquimarinus]|uniref:Atypical short-chain dehydrogenase/reductase n=1 Tax=Arcobacter aquimarinus TaxID=1315211 RepID=A0AAE7E0Y8_9BACT|nr:GDP-L-fucose synthase [Arcobacter aquimarinus]QKE25629.1 atypical short-chain dehydrogenase/reductase [Arcobacter aquimarinus]RXI35031.1 GDP-L-fucose synthase [Arcobacter aquimarinus]
MKTFTILGAGWLGLELAIVLKNDFKIKVSSRSQEKVNIYEEKGFSSYILNENNFEFLDKLFETNYLFINFPPSKFEDYLLFLNKIYSHEKIKNIEKIFFVSSTSIYPNIEGLFNEDYEIKEPNSKIVFEAENLVKDKSDVIFRVAGLVGANRYFGKRSANKIIEFPKTPINFVHRNDVINATKFIIEKDLSGIFNLCSNTHPTKEEIYSFNSKKYNFEKPIFLENKNFFNRLIDGSKIKKEGFTYKYENPFEF